MTFLGYFAACEPRHIAIFGGLAMLIWLLLGNIAWLFTGAVFGALLHAWWDAYQHTWDESSPESRGQKAKRKELSLDIVQRLVNWRSEPRPATATRAPPDGEGGASRLLDYSECYPATATALATTTDVIIQQYVEWWYKPILPSEPTFPAACRQALSRFVHSASSHLSRKRPAETFLHFLINSSSIIIVFLGELASALASRAEDPSSSVAESLQGYLDRNPDSSISDLLSTEKQGEKIRLVTADILQVLLDPDLNNCEVTKTFLREILSGVVLESVIESCSTPEFINGWIVHILEGHEPELISALDAGLEQANQHPTDQPPQILDGSKEAAGFLLGGFQRLVGYSDKINGGDAVVAGNNSAATARYALDSGEQGPMVPGHSARTPSHSAPGFSSTAGAGRRNITHMSAASVSAEWGAPGARKPPISVSAAFHNASVSILDDSGGGGARPLSAKPMQDYLLQVEPMNAHQKGWVIARQLTDFEALHQDLCRTSQSSGVACPTMPTWKGRTVEGLRQDLEQYLRHALSHAVFAASEGMTTFLDKSPERKPPSSDETRAAGVMYAEQAGLAAPAELPKAVSDDRKSAVEGATRTSRPSSHDHKQPETPGVPERKRPQRGASPDALPSPDSQLTREVFRNGIPPDAGNSGTRSSLQPHGAAPDPKPSPMSLEGALPLPMFNHEASGDQIQVLSPADLSAASISCPEPRTEFPVQIEEFQSPASDCTQGFSTGAPNSQPVRASNHHPLSEPETAMTIELIFAVINELYSLASVWKLRRALLTAAKSFLLRPGNPSLEFIRVLIQNSITDNTSDETLASYIDLMREKCLDYTEDSGSQVHQLSDHEKEELRAKARALLLDRGMPKGLSNLMGSNATSNALGTLFDSLQIQHVARGLVFAITLQALKIALQ